MDLTKYFEEGPSEVSPIMPYSPIKLSFLNKTYSVDGDNRTVKCTLKCKVHLDMVDQRCHGISQGMIKKTISRYLTVKGRVMKSLFKRHQAIDGETGELSQIRFTRINNIKELRYDPTFTVTGETTCDPMDLFDSSKGKHIAEAKAKILAYRKVEELTKDLFNQYIIVALMCGETCSKMHHLAEEKKQWLTHF